MTLDEMATLLDGLIKADALRADLVPGAGLVRDLVAHLGIADAEDDTEDDTEDDAEDADDAEDDAEDADDAEDETEDETEDEAGDAAEDADDDSANVEGVAEDTSEKTDNFRRGWDGRRLTGEPEGKDYLFRRASDGSWYCLRGRHVVWSDDRSAAEVRRGMRAAGATARGISTHAGSTVELVDAESGVVIHRYANRRRVD